MRIPPPPPPPPCTYSPPTPLYPNSKMRRKCESQPLRSEIAPARRIAAPSPILNLNSRKSYISRAGSLDQLQSKSRRDLVKSSLLSVTCEDSTSSIDDNQVAAIAATFSQLQEEDLDDDGDSIGSEALLQPPPWRNKKSPFQDSWRSIDIGGGGDDTVPSPRTSISSKHEFAATKSKLKATRRRSAGGGSKCIDASPRSPRKSMLDTSPETRGKSINNAPEASPKIRRRKSLLQASETTTPRINATSSSSHSRKKNMPSPGDSGTTPVVKDRKKKTFSKKPLKRNKSADDINWLHADAVDVSNCYWATLGLGPLVHPSITNSHDPKNSSVDDDTSSHSSGEEDSWYKLSMSTGLGESPYKKTTVPAATKVKNRVKNIR
jgi:hypothetical protein